MKKKQVYTCPMHHEITSDKPGKCSKCGMDLVNSDTKAARVNKKHVMNQGDHKKHQEHEYQDHSEHHRMMAEDFKKRFIITLPVTIIVLLLSAQIQKWFGFSIDFVGREFVLFILGTVIALYGGKPFLTAAKEELATKNWGMMPFW